MFDENVTQEERAYSLSEAAERLSLSVWTIRDWVNQRRIVSTKVGKRRLVPASEVARLIREGRTERRAAGA